ncbi:hypothetical protein F4861DRAFT_551131 [Xylaria intraflava]|nr:hypothetical protein F4861DRAFT_551131 [Xylaria intraflava]
MNWTEGNLARHSRGKQRNALIARQKQHFAKVRHNLLGGRAKQGPTAIATSFARPGSTSDSLRQGLPSRKRHDQSVTPLQSSKLELDWKYPTYLPDDNHATLPTNFDRRRRLLRKSDWAGLGLQRPLDISFPGQTYATKRWARVARTPDRISKEVGNHVTTQRERSGRPQRSSMRIHIGGQEIQPSVVTGSQQSVRRCTPDLSRLAHRSQRHYLASESSHHTHSASGHYESDYMHVTANEISRTIPTSSTKFDTPVNVVYASSVIHEPAPRRSGDFRVLQWSPSNSEDRGSMQVETDQPINLVSASQESEQQRWKDWTKCEEFSDPLSNSSLKATDASGIYPEDSGSSAITLPSHLQPRLPSFHLFNGPELPPEGGPPEPTNTEDMISKRNDSQNDRLPRENTGASLSGRKCTPQKIPDVPDDLNDVWMKFACGDDANSDELLTNAFKEAAHQAAVELRPSDPSSSADEHIEAAPTGGTDLCSVDDRYNENVASPRPSSESHVATQGTTVSEKTSSIIAAVGSSDGPAQNAVRFVIPKAFIGKNVNTNRAEIAPTFVASNPKRGKRQGKRRKVAMDGRTDIRNLPDFDGDPIEEIEDD